MTVVVATAGGSGSGPRSVPAAVLVAPRGTVVLAAETFGAGAGLVAAAVIAAAAIIGAAAAGARMGQLFAPFGARRPSLQGELRLAGQADVVYVGDTSATYLITCAGAAGVRSGPVPTLTVVRDDDPSGEPLGAGKSLHIRARAIRVRQDGAGVTRWSARRLDGERVSSRPCVH